MVAHVFNPSSQETQAGRPLLSSKPVLVCTASSRQGLFFFFFFFFFLAEGERKELAGVQFQQDSGLNGGCVESAKMSLTTMFFKQMALNSLCPLYLYKFQSIQA
jgi:hypothetical protein